MGANQTRPLDIATGDGSSVDPPVQLEGQVGEVTSVNINATSVFTNATFHMYELPHNDVDMDQIEERWRQTLSDRVKALDGQGRSQFVPLEIVQEEEPRQEAFGEVLPLLRELDMRYLHPEELFDAAKAHAQERSLTECSGVEAREDFVSIHGRIVGVVGTAGIGKTRLGVRLLLIAIRARAAAYVFHITLSDFDYTREYSIIEFLSKACGLGWEPPANDKLLDNIAASRHVYIALDGLDEAGFPRLSSRSEAISLRGRAKPDVILKSLLSGRLLPYAFKILISRSGAYHELHPFCKPLFTVMVLGINDVSQGLLFRALCPVQADFDKVSRALELNAAAKALCHIPIFAETLVPYVLNQRNGDEHKVISICDVFTCFVGDCLRNPSRDYEPKVVEQLAAIALDGMHRNVRLFDVEDLRGMQLDSFSPFLRLKMMREGRSLRILAGDKRVFFAHRLWQEYFASVKLMFFTELDDFEAALTNLADEKWEMVMRFLYGFLNSSVQANARPLVPAGIRGDFSRRSELLRQMCLTRAEECQQTAVRDFPVSLATLRRMDSQEQWGRFQMRPDDARLLRLCVWAHEARDEQLSAALGDSIPGEILVSRLVLSSQAAALCYVLATRQRRQVVINVGAYSEPATFDGDGAQVFLRGIAGTNHKIRKFHVRNANFHFETLLLHLDNLCQLELQSCNLSPANVRDLTQNLKERQQSIDVLDLSGNNLDESCVEYLAQAVHKIDRLRLMNCRIPRATNCLLAGAIGERTGKMEVVNLSQNEVDIQALSRCVHNIKLLGLQKCDLAGNEMERFADQIAAIDDQMDLLDLCRNNTIGASGLRNLSRCVHKIQSLLLLDCDIQGGDLEELSNAIAVMPQPIQWLSLGRSERLGSVGLGHLSGCVHNIKSLWLDGCNVTPGQLPDLVNAIAELPRPMKALNLDSNPLGDNEVELLTKCIHKISVLSITGCRFTQAGMYLLRNAVGSRTIINKGEFRIVTNYTDDDDMAN